MIKQTSNNVSLQNSAVKPGLTPSNALNIRITDVPDDVTDRQAVQLYRQTVVFHTLNSLHIVPYTDLGYGKCLTVKDDEK